MEIDGAYEKSVSESANDNNQISVDHSGQENKIDESGLSKDYIAGSGDEINSDEVSVKSVDSDGDSLVEFVGREGVDVFETSDSQHKKTVEAKVTFSSNDYDRIDTIAGSFVDKFIMSSSPGLCFQACVLTLYLHTLRVHLMSRKFFAGRETYVDLTQTNTYQHHKEIFFMLENKNWTLEFFKDTYSFEAYNGLEKLTMAMKNMFPNNINFHPTLIQNITLPRKKISLPKDLNTRISERINELQQTQKLSEVDLSVLFVDFTSTDIANGTTTAEDFPNRVSVVNKGFTYAYQTVGTLYRNLDPSCAPGSRFAYRVVNRDRLDVDHFARDFFFIDGVCHHETGPAKANYIRDFDDGKPGNCDWIFGKKKCLSLFPAMLIRDQTRYHLIGAVMCFTDSQSEGAKFFSVLPELSNSLSRLDPIGTYASFTVYHRELYILCGGLSKEWLSDEIISCCCKKYLEFATLKTDSNNVNFIPPHAFESFFGQLYSTEVDTGRRSTTTVVNLNTSSLDEPYKLSISLWEGYKNIFDSPTEWFFSVVNYPNQSHWMHVGIHASERSFFIYDPQNKIHNIGIVRKIIRAYIECEWKRHNEKKSIASTELLSWNDVVVNETKHKKPKSSVVKGPLQWTDVTVNGPLQDDGHSCGVLSLISFFRGVKLQNAKIAEIFKKWECSHGVEALKKYRKFMFDLMICDMNEDSFFEYFYTLLHGYIRDGKMSF